MRLCRRIKESSGSCSFCDNTPECMWVSFFGIGNGVCDECAIKLNGSFYLGHSGGAYSCFWSTSYPTPHGFTMCGASGGIVFSWQAGPMWILKVTGANNGGCGGLSNVQARYISNVSWNCTENLTLAYDCDDGTCSNWPSIAIIVPASCP